MSETDMPVGSGCGGHHTTPDEESDSFFRALQGWHRAVIGRSMRDFHGQCRALNLSPSQFRSLMQMRKRGAIGTGEVAHDLDISLAAASQLLDDLVRRDLAERHTGEADRRQRYYLIRPAGLAMLEEFHHRKSAWLVELARMVPEEEKEIYAPMLVRLARWAEATDTARGSPGGTASQEKNE